jgi:hypothetical protein
MLIMLTFLIGITLFSASMGYEQMHYGLKVTLGEVYAYLVKHKVNEISIPSKVIGIRVPVK